MEVAGLECGRNRRHAPTPSRPGVSLRDRIPKSRNHFHNVQHKSTAPRTCGVLGHLLKTQVGIRTDRVRILGLAP